MPIYDKIIDLLDKKEKLELEKEYKQSINQLLGVKNQKEFQELTGKIEVLGEILIQL